MEDTKTNAFLPGGMFYPVIMIILLVIAIACTALYYLFGDEFDALTLPVAIGCVAVFLGLNIISYFISKNKK